MTYTVKSVMPTGKNHDTYGVEFYVQFNEVEQAFPLWFKQAPEVGTTIDGEINGGKFKKARKEWKPENSSGGASSESAPVRSGKPAWKDNSDGMRQGMCFNNAANYVATLEFPKALTDSEWATTVFSYAQALYRMGDLQQAPEGAQETPKEEALENVQAVFGGAQAVPAK